MITTGKKRPRHKSASSGLITTRLLELVARYNSVILILAVCCAVVVISLLVIRDLRSANAQANKLYARAVNGLKRMGEMQYAAQETRRCMLYALTTTDSNLQVRYADESRDADQGVKRQIAELLSRANSLPEGALVKQLNDDWTAYLSVRDEEIALILEGTTGEAVSMDLAKGVPSFERVRRDLLEVQRMYDQDAEQGEKNLAFWSERSSLRLIGMVGFTFLISILAVIVIQRSRVLNAIQLTRLQMEFVASMSHELRTPLAVMGSAAENLRDGVVIEQASIRRYGEVLHQQNRAMSDLVDKILLFAATEDKHLNHVLESLPLAEVVATVVNRFQGSGVFINVECEPELPLVMANRVGLSQCLHNLVDNAIKYSGNTRSVRIRAQIEGFSFGSAREIAISVIDRGIGIKESELERIWDPFYRSPRVQSAQIHGTGLGLAMTKRIAESMGGRLTVMSALNEGTNFTLHLPAAPKQEGLEKTGYQVEAPSHE